MPLTLSLPQCHLQMTNKNVKFEILKPFFILALASERIYTILKVDFFDIGPEKMYCLQACVCTYQPGIIIFTGWGSEGVKETQSIRLSIKQ